jgi:uncharacterized membrane protein
MKKIILVLAAMVASGILFVNVYTSVVDAPNWGRDIPASLMAAREYFRAANPGTFFRTTSPLNQILAVLALIVCWRAGKRARVLCAAALVCAVGGEALTYAYFFPRNDIMFVAPLDADTEHLKAVWAQWTSMNWFRSAVIAVQVACDYLALLTVSKLP